MGGVSSFAQYAVVAEGSAIPIRKDVPFDKAALVGCGVLTGVGAVINAAKVRTGSTVAVIGTGGVGLNVIQGSQLAGAEKIIAVDLLDNKLKMATAFDATHTVNAGQGDPIEAVKELTGVDYAFEAVGIPQTVSQAFGSVKKGGVTVAVGMPSPDATFNMPLLDLIRGDKTLMGCYYGSSVPRVDIPKILDLYMAGKLKLDELISKTYSLDEINLAFADMQKGEAAKVVILF